MQKVICTVGLPGSGKSTWARQMCADNPNFQRVNKDTIRKEVVQNSGGKWNKHIEKEVERLRDVSIEWLLNEGYSVISDDTNFHPAHIARIQQVANETLGKGNYEFEINNSFCDVSLEECIKRDANRPENEQVGSAVIIRMWRQYLMPEPEEWYAEKDKPTAVVIDMDGTLSLFSGKKNPYKRDFENDVINTRLLVILRLLHSNGVQLLFVSGRSAEYEKQTLEFLARCGFTQYIPNWSLTMREVGDKRPDYQVKSDIYDHIAPNYSIMCAFDDRLQVKRFWVSKGVYVFDCNQYSLEF